MKPIGLDALVFMANAANPVESLTTEQLVDIYSGNIKNWAEVGGTKQELLAFQRPAGSGSQSLMQKLVMKDMPMESGDNVFRYATMSDILEGMLAYTGDNNTLGYSVFYYANYMYSLPELRFMAVDGVTPSSQTIYDGSYPFINAFYAVIRPDEPEDSNARRIFDWLTGEAGQQLVLDLGYVPVDKPEGAELPDGIVQTAEEVEVLQGYELAEGEHLIFHRLQEEIFEHEFPYGKLMIYDSSLKLRETFYNAYTYINDYEKSGRYDGRYLVIYQARAAANGETEYLSRIYDLQEYCFLDLPWTADLDYTLDAEKGFFVCVNRGEEYDYRNAYRVVNFAGETLVDKICDFDYVGLRQAGNCYIAERYPADEYWGKRVYWIYDENLVLKNVIAEAEADLPSEAERLPEVAYWVLGETQNCYLDADGNMLLNREIFDTTFGGVLEELPQEGFMNDGYPNVFDGEVNELFGVNYGEDYYYVDAMLNIYMKKGEEQLHFIKEPEERQEYYVVRYGLTEIYFDSDGELLRMSDGIIPDIVLSYEKESYVMIHQGSDGAIVEEYRYGNELLGRYEYPWVMDQYSEIHYLGDAQLVIRSAWENAAESGNEMLKTLIYQGEEQIACLAAANNNLTRECYDENGTLCIQIIEGYYTGKQDKKYWMYRNGTLSYIGMSEDAYCYAKNSMIKLDYGNYTYMYDYDGKQIIKAYQLMKEE